jgi:HK97 family phage major capsid protein
MNEEEKKKILEQYSDMEKQMNSAKEKIAELEREKGLTTPSAMGDTDERRLLRSFHCKDLKSLIATNVAHPKFNHVSINDKLAAIEMKKDLDISRFYAQIFEGAPADKGELEQPGHIARVKNMLSNRLAKETALAERVKAFGTDVSGGGAEWIETAISSSYIEEYLLEKKVANMFMEVPMPTNPFKVPMAKGGTIARIVGEGVGATDNSFGTDAVTFDAVNKLVELYNLPEELNEDSAVAILSMARTGVVEAQIKALETALINGDTTGTHMDSDVTAASDARKCFMGLRKLALANSSNGSVVSFGAAVGETKLDEMISEGGKFSINPREVLWVVSAAVYHQMTALTNVITVDKFGPLATILSGVLAAYKGKGIVTSEYLREDLNATGVYDNVTKTKGGILLVNKTRFWIGRRRPIKVRVALDSRAEYDRYQLVSYQRADFKGATQSATEKSVIYGVNITL